MSIRLVRILTCDTPGCEAPSPYVVQGEDNQAIFDGWLEYRDGTKPPTHKCPACALRSDLPPHSGVRTVPKS